MSNPDCSVKRRNPRSTKAKEKEKEKEKEKDGNRGNQEQNQAEDGKTRGEKEKADGDRDPLHRPRDGARAQAPPLMPGQNTLVVNPNPNPNPPLTSSMHGNLSPALEENVQHAHNCQWLGVRSALAKWQALTKDTMILQAIAKGVRAPLHSFPKPNTEKLRTCKPHPEITKNIAEYLQSQAIRLLNPQEIQSTNYWVPVFGREKKDSEKVRLITDLRDLNNCHNIQQHKPQTWKQVVELTQDQSLTWGVTLDLKAY